MKPNRTALLAVIAIGLLVASTVGVAAQADDPMAPSFFTGDAGAQWRAWGESSETRPDGVVVSTGSSSTQWSANDPRINGLATAVGTEVDYREGTLRESPTGLDGAIRGQRHRVVNDEGAWEGVLDLIQIDGVGLDIKVGWLIGEDAYEGLMAFVVVDYTDPCCKLSGHITPDGPPQVPETFPEG